MPIHSIAQFNTDIYSPDEDQESSYLQQNSGCEDDDAYGEFNIRSTNEGSHIDIEDAKEVAEQERVCRAREKDMVSAGDIVTSQGKLT